jgi:hypothetical protein
MAQRKAKAEASAEVKAMCKWREGVLELSKVPPASSVSSSCLSYSL